LQNFPETRKHLSSAFSSLVFRVQPYFNKLSGFDTLPSERKEEPNRLHDVRRRIFSRGALASLTTMTMIKNLHSELKREEILALAHQARLMIADGDAYYVNDMATDKELLAFARLLVARHTAPLKGSA
jgi:hypothetical protein